MWKWVLRILGAALALIIVALALQFGRFQNWEAGLKSDLLKNSTIAETAQGPIEYAEIGQGPAVLVVHGTPGGYDDPLAALKITHAENNGFRYIVSSRPGY